MLLKSVIASAFLVSAASLPATAQETDRYTMEKSANGYVRMDRRTGEMSICEERSGQLVCKLAADERSAFQDEVERLQDRVSGLEKHPVAEIETVSRLNPQGVLPTEEEFEKSLGYMERFFRRFMEIVKDFDQDWRTGKPDPEPQKTLISARWRKRFQTKCRKDHRDAEQAAGGEKSDPGETGIDFPHHFGESQFRLAV